MGKQITLLAVDGTANKVNNLANMATEAIHRITDLGEIPLLWLNHYYSTVLERPINKRQTKALTMAQLAFFATVMPVEYPVLLRVATCIWFITSLLKCRRIM